MVLDKFDRVVKKEMDRYGFDLTIVRNLSTNKNYDVSKGELVSNLESTPARGIFFDMNLWSNGDKTETNTLIKAGDKQLYIMPKTKDLQNFSFSIQDLKIEQDYVIVNSVRWKIVSYKEINPSTQNSYLWMLYVRK